MTEAEIVERLTSVRGVGPWTVEMIAMRGLGDPDAFPSTDMGVVKAGRELGITGDLAEHAHEHWRPWRSYALMRLWSVVLSDVRPPPDPVHDPQTPENPANGDIQ